MIWLTYKRFIIENNLSNCFLLTANTKDFYDENKKDLHPDLKSELPNLQVFKSTKELILNVESLNRLMIEEELEIWSILNLNEDEIEKIFYDEINIRLISEIKDFYTGESLNNKTVDEIETSFISDVKIVSKSFKIIQDFCFFSCKFEAEIPTLFSNYEELIDDYIREEYIIKVSATLNFTIRPNEKAQITDIENIRSCLNLLK